MSGTTLRHGLRSAATIDAAARPATPSPLEQLLQQSFCVFVVHFVEARALAGAENNSSPVADLLTRPRSKASLASQVSPLATLVYVDVRPTNARHGP